MANDKIQERAGSENHLMSEIKVKNQFLNKVKKNRKRIRKSYIEYVKSRIGEYYETKPLWTRTSKCRKNILGEAEKIAEVNRENLQWKKTDKAEVSIKHPREQKNLLEKKIAMKNSKFILSGTFDFDPEEYLDKSFLVWPQKD